MELNSRVRALLRRSNGSLNSENSGREADCCEFDKVKIDLKGGRIFNGGQTYELSALETRLMRYFIRHAGECISREQIFSDIWKYNSAPNTRTLDVHICNLRRKMEADPKNPRHLLTIQGTGYKFLLEDLCQ
jgi:DNA-binding response OmpR family regulator